MTLIAAFRCRNGGILLCADRKEDDSFAVRPVDKIYRIGELRQCQIFLAGSGTTASITDAETDIHRSFVEAAQADRDVLAEHSSIIESSLKRIHIRHKEDLRKWPLDLLVVIAPHIPNTVPILYRSDRSNLISEPLYIAYGTGKTISDYFAYRLYKHGLPNDSLAVLAAFILREAENSASGVGLGSDMVFISSNGLLQFLHTESIEEIQAGIPPLADAISSYWNQHVTVPKWLKDYAASTDLPR